MAQFKIFSPKSSVGAVDKRFVFKEVKQNIETLFKDLEEMNYENVSQSAHKRSNTHFVQP